MKIYVDGDMFEIWGGTLTQTFSKQNVLINGNRVDSDYILSDGDEITIIEPDVMPSKEKYELMLSSRHSPEVHARVKSAHVAILGLGGLGSNIAIMLARLGVGKLTLVDFDRVEPTNLNRQCYFVEDLDKCKAYALKSQIARINPYIEVNAIVKKVTVENVFRLIGDANIVAEAFDRAETKAAIVAAILENTRDIKVVCGSGMAGYGPSNDIITKCIGGRLIVSGDGVTDSRIGIGLMSPRVTVCAAHQANAILRLIMGLEP